MDTDTIAAIATAMSNSGIGIIRISGSNSLSVIDQIYRSKNGKKYLSEVKSHTLHYGMICDGAEVIDEVLVAVMKAPNSYTKEDTVEIQCHGGIVVMKRILETVIQHGARMAEPGEFTKRAFLNGRMDLSQAESVMDLISAKNEFARQNSLRQLQGDLSQKIQTIRQQILHQIAFIESALDDPEHVSLQGYRATLGECVQRWIADVDNLLKNSENGVLLKEGIHTVIVGKPNAGKSSLLNVLVGKERAIVTEIAGTTRDVLEEQISLDGIILHVVDTAGIRSTEDTVEQIGVKKAKEYLQQADLILYVMDASVPLDESDEEILSMIRDRKAIVLLNKSDLDQQIEEQQLAQKLNHPILSVSMRNQTGVKELSSLIQQMFFQGRLSIHDEVFLTNIRQIENLREASQSLCMVNESIGLDMPEDFYSIDLMNAYEALGKILGESVEEDLIDEIFSKFCVGK